MKIAITADVHLTSRDKHPERFHALENILDQLAEQDIQTLIIAGDLFDATCTTPGEFEEVVKRYSQIDLFILPGNHDPSLAKGTFSLPNIRYIADPQKIEFANSLSFVFIPYRRSATVGEILAENKFEVEQDSWVLISHGDWLSGTSPKNNYEDGTYMPLSGRDLLQFKPGKAFLGHIHAEMNSSTVHYSGSPCAIDPTEIGYRSFLIFDSATWKVISQRIDTDFLFFNEQIVVLPLDDEETYIKKALTSRMNSWKLSSGDQSKVRVRVKVRGYSKDRERLVRVIRDQMKDYQFTDKDQPDISQVKMVSDVNKQNIVNMVQSKIDGLVLDAKPDESDQDEILLEALNYIYGVK